MNELESQRIARIALDLVAKNNLVRPPEKTTSRLALASTVVMLLAIGVGVVLTQSPGMIL